MAAVDTPSDLTTLVGRDVGPSDPTVVTADQLSDFAASTGATGTEYLALSLVNLFLPQLVEVRSFSMGVNVGLQSVRFGPAIVAGDTLVGTGRVVSVEPVGEGFQSVVEITVTSERVGEPLCVAATVSRYFP